MILLRDLELTIFRDTNGLTVETKFLDYSPLLHWPALLVPLTFANSNPRVDWHLTNLSLNYLKMVNLLNLWEDHPRLQLKAWEETEWELMTKEQRLLAEEMLNWPTKLRMEEKFSLELPPKISKRTKSGCVSGSIILLSTVSGTSSATMLLALSSTTQLKMC